LRLLGVACYGGKVTALLLLQTWW